MTNVEKGFRLEVQDSRVICPGCGHKTDQVVLTDTEAENLPVFCRRCKRRIRVKIKHGECLCLSARA